MQELITLASNKNPMSAGCWKVCSLLFLQVLSSQMYSQGNWTQKADFSGAGRIKAVGFSIGNKGYIGTGQTSASSYLKDFWEYDPCNAWIRRADFPGTARTGAVGFSIGNKGYIGTGDDGSGSYEKDFWEYDPSSNTWTQKADFGGIGRRFAFAFSIGNKGYIGTGDSNSGLTSDFWEYDPVTDTWTQVASLPAAGRKYAGGFVVNGNAYVGCGTPGPLNDFWEFNPLSNSWTQKTDYPGMGPEATTSFILGNLGYMGLGDNYTSFGTDLWQYDHVNDSWTQMANFTGTARETAVGFSICGKGYVGTGGQGFSLFVDEFWEYTPPNFVANNCFLPPVADFTYSAFSNCGDSCVSFSDASLFDPLSWQWIFSGATTPSSTIQNPTNICYNGSGSYDVTLIVSKGSCADTITKPILIVDSCNSITVSDSVLCPGDCIDFFAEALPTASGFLWSFPGASPAFSTDRNPSSICYSDTGIYNVSVTFLVNGITDTIIESNFIVVADSACPVDTITVYANGDANGGLICADDCLNYTAQSATPADSYLWEFPGGQPNTSNSQNPMGVCYPDEGVFDVILIYSKNGISDTIVRSGFVNVAHAEIIVSASDTVVESGSQVQFNAEGGATYNWTSDGLLDCYDCPNPVAVITSASDFIVEVVDSNGCIFRDTILVRVENACEDAVMIASAFSPNGDTKNDFIQPFINADISSFSFKIFNRWGEEVFTSSNTSLSWDGTYKGAQQDIQVFTYVVQFSCLGKEYLKSGNITLIH